MHFHFFFRSTEVSIHDTITSKFKVYHKQEVLRHLFESKKGYEPENNFSQVAVHSLLLPEMEAQVNGSLRKGWLQKLEKKL